MPAKPIAAMGRSYRYPQADRHDCLQFAARQRSVEDGKLVPTIYGPSRGNDYCQAGPRRASDAI
jgi:hypothetical protein